MSDTTHAKEKRRQPGPDYVCEHEFCPYCDQEATQCHCRCEAIMRQQRKTIERLRAALEWYADELNWSPSSSNSTNEDWLDEHDGHGYEVARLALAGLPIEPLTDRDGGNDA